VNRGDIRNYAYDFLKTSESQGPWSVAEMDRYAQDAHMKMFGMVADTFEHFFAVTANLSEVTGVDLIQLPTDLYRILSVERIGGLQSTAQYPMFLTKIERTQNDINGWRGNPYLYSLIQTMAYPMAYYAIGQKQIRLIPIPGASSTNSLRLSYIYRPTPLVGDTDVPFQQTAGTGGAGTDNLVEFHDILPLYMIEKCLLTPGEENPGLAGEVRSMRLERENELKTYLSRINLQAPRTMDVTDGVTDYD
jgi:hypothetical protein